MVRLDPATVDLDNEVDTRTPDQRRQQRWAEVAGERARRERRARLRDVRKRRAPIERALQSLTGEHRNGPARRSTTVWLRSAFVFTDANGRELATSNPDLHPQRRTGLLGPAVRDKVLHRPPLGRLVHRGGWALRLELSALIVGSLRQVAGELPDWSDIENVVGATSTTHSWAALMGDPAGPADARRHLVAALARLDEEKLVRLARKRGGRQPWNGWRPLAEDDSGAEYTPAEEGLGVPVNFWLNGWAHLLTPPEVAAYLMIRHTATATTLSRAHAEDGIGRPQSIRELNYGISQSTYQALHELEEFGLVERTHDPRALTDPPAQPDDPRVVARFKLIDEGLQQPAPKVIEHKLKHHPTPWRLVRYNNSWNDWTDDLFGVL